MYDYIIGHILVGAFPVETRLPAEMQLAERLSVSRPVVRQALRRPRTDGILFKQIYRS
ncbi:GntR family transcriptional regulator [Thalassorhabdomicrobium marinisediminis]|uniref:GntR family transcriptional regulator n=1 Tax=Thalassorhabdomicrobium marinisediminis TaxID=2170577 RepID=UPI00249203C7|nr:GntR family transcriptional regulator [Thalassorhabdomicrobium marinisediminis]